MLAVPAQDAMQVAAVCKYLGAKTGRAFDPGMCAAFAILNDQQDFVAGVVISNFRKHDCEISCATDTSTAWRPHIMRAVFGYIFGQLGCVRVTAITRKQNKRSRDFLKALGFELEGNVRLGYDGQKDALIYGLLASECRYFGDLNGQVNTASARRA
jgi:RimJ/RimL family protein N-acetyltransferase